jgi:ArsR family transcriptional regulator
MNAEANRWEKSMGTFTLIAALPMENLASYFKGLADENRLRILNLLFHGELCGCDIQHVLGASQSNVSRHLAYLKNAGLVSDRRAANRVYYSLAQRDEPKMDGLFKFLEGIFGNNPLMAKDHKKLLSAIKDGDCSVSEAPLKTAPRSSKRVAKKA